MLTITNTQWEAGGFATIVILLVGIIVQWSVRRFGQKRSFHKKRVQYVQRSAQTLLFLLWLLVEAFIFGIDLHGVTVLASSIFALFGIAFFATWSVLSNITSAALIFFFFPYRIGDQIQIREPEYNIEGQIVDMTLFWVKIECGDSNLTCYPNNQILQKPITRIVTSSEQKPSIVNRTQQIMR